MTYRCTTSTTHSFAPFAKRAFATFAIACGLGMLGLWGCEPPASDASPSDNDGASTETSKSAPIPVETLTVRTRNFIETFDVPATAEPLEQITVAAEAGGRVLAAPFEEGDEIRAGGRLLSIDTELDSARINLLEAQLESAQREYERTKNLQQKGLATTAQLDQAEDALENARLSLDQAKVGASKGGVRSPMSGVVLTKHVKKGEFASPGQPIATIIQYDKLIVRGQVPETRISYIGVGDTVQIEFRALQLSLHGTVTRRALTGSPSTGTYAVEVTVDNADLAILPGMSARMTVVKKQWDEAVMIPREAILQGFARSEAMVLPVGADADSSKSGKSSKSGEAELRVVELGPSDGPNVVITSGLADGDRLIVRGHRGLVNGALASQVRHFESIEQMRGAGAAVDLSQKKPASQEDNQGNSQQSEADSASEGKGQ
jgi:membrane fusion protein (multidrug efflux system)